MPKAILKKPDPLPVPEGIFKKSEIKKTNITQLKKICATYKIPYSFLTREKIMANVIAWLEKKEIPFPALGTTFKEQQNMENQKITPQLRAFALDYSQDIKGTLNKEWAEKYNVTIKTILRWLGRPDVKKLIEKFTLERESAINEKFTQHQLEVIESLLDITKTAKSIETRRKAILDFFGLAGRKNINNGTKIVVAQGQSNSNISTAYSNIPDEELEKEIKNLEEELQ